MIIQNIIVILSIKKFVYNREFFIMAIKLNKAFEKMLKKYAMETPIKQNQAIFLWKDIVGEQIASHTKAEKVSYGKLYISVDSPVWRNELVFQKEEILEKINIKLEKVLIKDIILR